MLVFYIQKNTNTIVTNYDFFTRYIEQNKKIIKIKNMIIKILTDVQLSQLN